MKIYCEKPWIDKFLARAPDPLIYPCRYYSRSAKGLFIYQSSACNVCFGYSYNKTFENVSTIRCFRCIHSVIFEGTSSLDRICKNLTNGSYQLNQCTYIQCGIYIYACNTLESLTYCVYILQFMIYSTSCSSYCDLVDRR